MALTTQELRAAAVTAHAAMQAREPELNAADRVLGDGDTGVTLRRVFEAIAAAAATAPDDIGGFFRAVGMASAGATGSSLGTLLAVALLEVGKEDGARPSLEVADIAILLRRAQGVMSARGKAAIGDKTVLDAIDAVAAAVAGATSFDEAGAAAVIAARAALETYRGKPCRAGRARRYGDKSIGHDDPGMLAFVRLVEALTGAGESAAGGVT